MQLKKAACTRSQTFLQLQAPGAVSGWAGPPPAPSLGRGSAGELLTDGGSWGCCSYSTGRWGFQGPASAQKCLTFSVYMPLTGCAEGRKSLRNQSERETEHSSPPVGSPPLLDTLSAQFLLCVPVVEQFTTNVSVFLFGLVGKAEGSALLTVSLLRPWDH